ncbi:MAG: nickel pincer cofactor biosynthesis protein LarB [Candidatus Krumholzibacteriota bacterium]|nr:nickel pincer cofactor biosynthesis protein LarB [Candidatus Krumholzibacteriota bacterium]
MDTKRIRTLLEALAAGRAGVDATLDELAGLGVRSLHNAALDGHRELRTGFPEVILCESKTPAEVADIVAALDEAGSRILATRARPEHFEAAAARVGGLDWRERAQLFVKRRPPRDDCRGRVLVVSAGTSDAPVAEEAAWTARMMGAHVETLYDVGVAGIHRLTAHAKLLAWPDAIVVAAGMEGALPSVVGGLVGCPVIGVPTSVGYGSSFGGLSALLGMLNSCAAGLTVVNIDNGFGAGLAAARIARRLGEAEAGRPDAPAGAAAPGAGGEGEEG